jgi:chromosome partitioning protein
VKPNLADLFDESLSFRLFRADPKLFVHPSPFPKLEQRHKIFRIREIVDALGYPTVFFDTPPSDNVLTLSALVAADRVLVPFDCDDFARRAIAPVLERVEEARADHNPRLRVEGVVVNQFLGRANFPQQAVDALAGDGLRVLEPYISSSVRIRESHHAARPMVFFEAGHKVTAEFEELYGRLARRADRRRAEKKDVVAAG